MKYNNLINNINTFYKMAGFFDSDFSEWENLLRANHAAMIEQVTCKNKEVFPKRPPPSNVPVCQATATEATYKDDYLDKDCLIFQFLNNDHSEQKYRTIGSQVDYVKKLLTKLPGYNPAKFEILTIKITDADEFINNPEYLDNDQVVAVFAV